jgi:oxygen-independent coproporphyrinogen-3 oxidase
VYVHFPYCLAKCPYCDFVSYAAERSSIDSAGYADAVIAELEARAASFEGREVASVFFGGGTPSLWDPSELGRVLAAITTRFRTSADLEVTVECNPTSLDEARARGMKDVGVNRLSIGVQALKEEQLKFLGRLHDPDGALRAIEGALASGIGRVSADMIFGMAGQAPDDARQQAERLASLGLRHLSCYQLTIEHGTQFGTLAKMGRLPLADDARVAEAFLAIDEALAARSLAHYEISNYAARGEEARHNLGYWRGEEYLGLGCGAYGMIRERDHGVRYRNQIDPKKYVAAAMKRESATITSEDLDPTALLRERIMLGLRLAGGFDLAHASCDLDLDPWTPERTRTIDHLAARGRLVRDGNRLRIPRDAWLFTDDTAARLF